MRVSKDFAVGESHDRVVDEPMWRVHDLEDTLVSVHLIGTWSKRDAPGTPDAEIRLGLDDPAGLGRTPAATCVGIDPVRECLHRRRLDHTLHADVEADDVAASFIALRPEAEPCG